MNFNKLSYSLLAILVIGTIYSHAMVGVNITEPSKGLLHPSSYPTKHHINIDGQLFTPHSSTPIVKYGNDKPLVPVRAISEKLGYYVDWNGEEVIIDGPISTVIINPSKKSFYRKGKLSVINLDREESSLPMILEDGHLYVEPVLFTYFTNDVHISDDEIFIAPQRSYIMSPSL